MTNSSENVQRIIEVSPLDTEAMQVRHSKKTISLEILAQEYIEDITRLAWRLLGWRQDVEDIVQDVLLTAAQKIHTLRSQTCIKSWLFTITINKCRTWKYRRRLQLLFFQKNRRETVSRSVAEEISEQEKLSIVRQAVQSLPVRYRETVVLKYLEQIPNQEILEMLGITENALNVRLHRAKFLLHEKLKHIIEEK